MMDNSYIQTQQILELRLLLRKKNAISFKNLQNYHIAYDKDEHPVFLAEGTWLYNTAREMFPEIEFHLTSEFKMNANAIFSIEEWAK